VPQEAFLEVVGDRSPVVGRVAGMVTVDIVVGGDNKVVVPALQNFHLFDFEFLPINHHVHQYLTVN
jgi:hypothetical protein